ncbi:MAG: 3-hydroxyacyl-CoA dehydrogenase/enoyl-CoA hydratase family protein [Proteobacteria bacterium]|nr:3-hydroxyacyl-CoA dehydrogenase/enoyl-CoA hydratase family protein [Pseudomonadota bacterium]
MTRRIEKVAVLGAGVMGSGIAAHLANAGIPSLLFDLERPTAALKALAKTKPAPLFHKDLAHLIEPCTFGDDIARLGEVDWVIEAVTERLDIKRKVFAQVRTNAKPTALITSNTSGIPIADMTEGTDESFRKRFFVTHFFNPVRYMKLLELVSGPETDPEAFQFLAEFGERRLGKGIVVGKDTPNFVANRIGTFGMMALLHKIVDAGFNVTDIDSVFGKPLGRPKSAVFRTADLVGLDTLAHVAANCFENLTEDPNRDVFKLPAFLTQLIERGDLGGKTGAGFYKKTRVDGKKAILALNLETMEYEAQSKTKFASIGATRNIEDPAERTKQFLAHGDEASNLAWAATADTLLYSAELLGEIADDVVSVDNALKWGFGWDAGPFETWDAIGLTESVARMEAEGRTIPAIVRDAIKAGGWYDRTAGTTRYLDVLGDQERHAVPHPAGAIYLQDVKDVRGVVSKNMGASILDLGDGILGLEFQTKMNSIDGDIGSAYNEALDLLENSNDWAGLVVANEGRNFSVGANVMLVLMAAMQKEWGQIESLTKGLQDTLMRAKYCSKPVVTAPHQMALGGGAEIAMHGSACQATGELYIGLVEVGVGLLPGAGGCKETIFRLVGSIPNGVDIDVAPYVQKAFMQIGMGQVATSAGEAKAFGYLRPHEQISMNRDLQIADAKALALGMSSSGWVAPTPRSIRLPGRTGAAAIGSFMWGMKGGGQISEYDMHVGTKVAHVLNGGDIASGGLVTEQDMLDLEREAFLSLCGEEKTMARIQHMLQFNKPLRN